MYTEHADNEPVTATDSTVQETPDQSHTTSVNTMTFEKYVKLEDNGKPVR